MIIPELGVCESGSLTLVRGCDVICKANYGWCGKRETLKKTQGLQSQFNLFSWLFKRSVKHILETNYVRSWRVTWENEPSYTLKLESPPTNMLYLIKLVWSMKVILWGYLQDYFLNPESRLAVLPHFLLLCLTNQLLLVALQYVERTDIKAAYSTLYFKKVTMKPKYCTHT